MASNLIFFAISGPADFVDTKLACPSYPIPPASALLNISSADDPMCPGGVATYKCISGGINAFSVIFSYVFFDKKDYILLLFISLFVEFKM